MTITYPLSLPDNCSIDVTLSGIDAVAFSASPFTFKGQAHVYPGQMWRAQLTVPPYDRARGEPWVAFLLALRGQAGTFLMGDRRGAVPRGSAGGSPLVNGADQTGATLSIDGATAGQTGWLKAGDYIQLGTGASSRLHKVLKDADSDGSGQATLDIWPSLRSSPADNATVTLVNTVGVFRLDGNAREWSIDVNGRYRIQISASEVV